MKQPLFLYLPLCTLVTAFVLAATSPASAQPLVFSDDEKLQAREMLSSLSGGTLIVRLNSNHRKMKELERLASSTGISEKKSAQFREMLQTTAEETRQENSDIHYVFSTYYNFSKVLYMYDTASLQLKNGVKSGYFLDSSLQVNPSIRLEDDDWLMIYFRHESPALFKLLDKNLKEVLPTFPLPKRPRLSFVKKLRPAGEEGTDLSARILATGPSGRYLLYSRRKQRSYFSWSVYDWNNALQRTLRR
ncbi:MAG: hypothetical protein RI973_1844 [Bacteroidota bacterium]|jgi:hypothetical protein